MYVLLRDVNRNQPKSDLKIRHLTLMTFKLKVIYLRTGNAGVSYLQHFLQYVNV